MFEPFGDVTVLPAAAWHPEPLFRGTFGILSSCLITMTLCIWTTLHLNLPEHKKENRQFYRKIKWLLLGLFVPEVVVWNAWYQRNDVKDLSSIARDHGLMTKDFRRWPLVQSWFRVAWQRLLALLLIKARDYPDSQEKPQYNGRVNSWTDVHSWYIIMGGLAFADTSPEDLQFMPGKRQRVTLTTYGFSWLMNHEPGLIPDISRQYIEDKSKSDGLAKALTCWQATYFCIQCAFRLSQNLTLTLLELNVFAHALCALILLVLWWDKPRDIQEPTLITGEEAMNACAFLCLHIRKWDRPAGRRSSWEKHEPCSDFWDVQRPTAVSIHRQRDVSSGDPLLADKISRERWNYFFGPSRQPCVRVLDSFWTIRHPEYIPFNIDGRTLQRLARGYKVVADPLNYYGHDRLVDRSRNWDYKNYRDSMDPRWPDWTDFMWIAAGLTIAGGCYGGLHLLAWKSQFPSNAETILWRAASVTIMATGPLFAAIYLTCCLFKSVDRVEDPVSLRHLVLNAFKEAVFEYGSTVLVLICSPLALWYAICRAFIVVECFIMLAHVPETALHVPTWAAYIPSIS